MVITTPRFKVTDRVTLAAELPEVTDAQQSTLNLLPGRISRLRTAMDTLNATWRQGWSPDSVTHEYQVGDRMTYDPTTAIQQIDDFAAAWPKMIGDVLAMQKEGIDAVPINAALTHLGVKVAMTATAK